MSEILSVISGKGGVGKTFFSINFSYSLAKFNKKVLLIDGNITAPNASIILKIDRKEKTLHDFLKSEIDIKETIIKTKYNFDIIPGSIYIEDLININLEKLYIIPKLKKDYDYIIIDSSAGLGKETYSMLKISDKAIIITNPEKSSIIDAIRAKKICRVIGIEISGVIINKYNNNINLDKIEYLLGEKILGIIHEDKNVLYSMNIGIPLLEISPNSIASIDILNITKKIIGIKDKNEIKKESIIKKIMRIIKWK